MDILTNKYELSWDQGDLVLLDKTGIICWFRAQDFKTPKDHIQKAKEILEILNRSTVEGR